MRINILHILEITNFILEMIKLIRCKQALPIWLYLNAISVHFENTTFAE
jgi:hypothetical protein